MTDETGDRAEVDLTVKYHGDVFDVVRAIDPSTGQELEFVRAPDVVRVYALEGENLWLIREKRPGLGAGRHLRAVSGSVEDGETAEDAAVRELREEAGIVGRDFVNFHESAPGLKMLYRVLHFACHVQGFGRQMLESGEDISVARYPLRSIPALVWDGRFAEDLTAFAALKLARQSLDIC